MKEQNKITCFYKQHQADSKLQQSQVSIGVKRNINKHKWKTCWVKSIIVTKYINTYY